jgi:iron complex outermembrane receptor protein
MKGGSVNTGVYVGICSIAFLAAGNAAARSNADTAKNPQSATAEDDTGIADIVVTAQRRSQRMQDVPISVSVLTSDRLAVSAINSTFDLPKVTPGLQTIQVGTAFLPFLRGVGSSQPNPGFDSAVAIYIDGIYQAAKNANVFDLPNVERIEVLKGPQGTLFGRNVTGGAISITTRDPGSTPEGSIEGTYGRFNDRRVRAYLSAPITDTLAASASFSGRWDDGYIYDTFRNVDGNPSKNIIAMGKIAWEPSDNFTAKLSGSYSQSSDPTIFASHVLLGTIAAGTDPNGTNGLPVTNTNNYEMRSNHDIFITSDTYRVTLDAAYDLGFAKLVSLTGYVTGEGLTISNSPAAEISTAFSGARQFGKQVTQEVQLQSNRDGPANWILGGYYGWFYEGFDNLVSATNLPTPIRAADLSRPGARALGFDTSVKTNAYAAFLDATWSITPSLRVTSGVRYSSERRSVSGDLFAYGAREASVPNTPLYNTVLGDDGLMFGRSVLASVDKSKTFSQPTWRAVVDYRVHPGLMAYASYNRGFKSGTFNPTSVSPNAVPIEPEKIDAFELGMKADLMDGHLRINAAAFYYDYSNLQVSLVTGSGVVSVQNAASAKIKGIDLDIIAKPVSRLTLTGAINILDTRYSNYPGAQIFLPRTTATCAGPPPQIRMTEARTLAGRPKLAGNCSYSLDATGQKLSFAPDVTANASVEYKVPLKSGDLALSAALYYNGGYDVSPGGLFAHIGSYKTVSLSATYRSRDSGYFIRLWGDNVTNDNYAVYLSPQAIVFQEALARPASYGVTIGFGFR